MVLAQMEQHNKSCPSNLVDEPVDETDTVRRTKTTPTALPKDDSENDKHRWLGLGDFLLLRRAPNKISSSAPSASIFM